MFTAIYLRVSTDEQAQSGVSLAMQRDLCEKYVELHDLPGDTVIYTEDGQSAKDLNRPQLTRLRDDLESGMVSHVVVFKLDRLTRKVGDLCQLLAEFEDHGACLHGVRDKLDTGTASGRLVLHIMGAVAEWERDTIADRTRSGLRHIQSQGFHIGNAPFGWDLRAHDGPGSLLVPNDDYHLIADARAARDSGMSLAGIGNIIKGHRHPQVGKRIVEAPLVDELVAGQDSSGVTMGYKHPA